MSATPSAPPRTLLGTLSTAIGHALTPGKSRPASALAPPASDPQPAQKFTNPISPSRAETCKHMTDMFIRTKFDGLRHVMALYGLNPDSVFVSDPLFEIKKNDMVKELVSRMVASLTADVRPDTDQLQQQLRDAAAALDEANARSKAAEARLAALQAEVEKAKATLFPPRLPVPTPPSAPPPISMEANRVYQQLEIDAARNETSTVLLGSGTDLAQVVKFLGENDPDRRLHLAQYAGGQANLLYVTRPDPAKPLKVFTVKTRTAEQAGRVRAALRQEIGVLGLNVAVRPAMSKLQLAYKRLVYQTAVRRQATEKPKVFWSGHKGAYNYEAIVPDAGEIAAIATEIPSGPPRPPRGRVPRTTYARVVAS